MLRLPQPRFWLLNVSVWAGLSVVPGAIPVMLKEYAVGPVAVPLTVMSVLFPSCCAPLQSDSRTVLLVLLPVVPVAAMTTLPPIVVGSASVSPLGMAGESSHSFWLLPALIATVVPLAVGLERLSFRVIVASLRR